MNLSRWTTLWLLEGAWLTWAGILALTIFVPQALGAFSLSAPVESNPGYMVFLVLGGIMASIAVPLALFGREAGHRNTPTGQNPVFSLIIQGYFLTAAVRWPAAIFSLSWLTLERGFVIVAVLGAVLLAFGKSKEEQPSSAV